MLIDEFLPEHDFSESHDISVQANAATVYSAINDVDFGESAIVRWLFRLRGWPTKKITLRGLGKLRFETLGETINKELLLGLAGRFWTIRGDLRKIDSESFKEFDEAGYAKTVWSFSLDEDGSQTRLTTETRIKCLDVESRRSFGRYWMFIRPFSGLIRMEMLKTIKRKAESREA